MDAVIFGTMAVADAIVWLQARSDGSAEDLLDELMALGECVETHPALTRAALLATPFDADLEPLRSIFVTAADQIIHGGGALIRKTN